MTSRNKVFAGVGTVLGLALLVLVLVPILFKDRIAERLQAEVDRAVDADVSWTGVELTLIRSFPSLTLGLRELRVVGAEPFAGDTLASIARLRIALDVGSVIRSLRQRGPLVVRSIRIDEPEFHLRMLEDGSANWDILSDGEPVAETTDETEPARDFSVALRGLEVYDGRLSFDDARSGLDVSVEGLRHSLSGDFSRESLVASTRTLADRTTVRFAGTPYLAGVAVDFDADLDVDLVEKRVALLDNELRLNDLLLRFEGEVARPAEDVTLDVRFAAPETDFRQILSLVPAIYAQDYASLETSGRFEVSGHVQGDYGEASFPAFGLDAIVVDGSFRYPDLPLPARAISAALSIANPGGDVDSTVVNLSRFHVEIGGQPIDGAVLVRTPVSDLDIDLRVAGTLDLEALSRTVKLDGVEDLEGVITTDATVRARMSDLDAARYESVAASGSVAVRDLTLASPDLRQPVSVQQASISLSPEEATLDSFQALLGSSDVQATGQIENLLGFVMRDEPLRGNGTFSSRHFILDEWRSGDGLTAIPVPAMLDLSLDGTIDRLVYEELEMANARGSVRVQDERLTLEGFTFGMLGGRVGMSGHYETLDPTEPTFSFAMALDSLDIAGASAAFLAVRTLAPVARYARGSFSADLDLSGALARDMTPVLGVLDGGGSLLTSRIEIQDFPMLERLSSALRVNELSQPTFDAIRSSVRIEDGRMHVAPFDVTVAGLSMTVDGSTGIDQSLDYSLSLAVPRALMGGATGSVLQDLATRAGRAGFDASAAEAVRVGVRVGGTVEDPSLDLGLGETVASVRDLAGQAAGAVVDRQVQEARERIEQAEEEARQRAQARADSLVADAERRAETIRVEARRLADQVRAEGDRRADEVLAQATNPIARQAAQPVANRIRQEAGERADQIVAEADERADALVAEARRRADAEGGGA